MRLKIGTRKSKLALIQTNLVITKINQLFPHIDCQIVPIITTGDQITDKNLYDIGGKALFLKELEEKLLSDEIDIAVHSLKDVPGILPDELEIIATLEREDPRDCFISHQYQSLADLPQNSIVGTSSVRRKVIIQQTRPDLKLVQFRGNIDTRLHKLQEQKVDATILACAGLKRAGMFDPNFCHPIDVAEMIPAAGQGIICIESKKNNTKIKDIIANINHQETWQVAAAERGFLSYLDASCRTPIGAYAAIKDNKLFAQYMLANITGDKIIYHNEIVDISQADEIGKQLGIKLSKLIF